MHAVAAKAVALREAAEPGFREYAHQVVANSRALADGLLSAGFKLWSGGSDNHLLVVELQDRSYTGAKLAEALDYVPVPSNVVELIHKTWSQEIKGSNGQPIFAAMAR
jgi:glycine hydroxymethyltransferase